MGDRWRGRPVLARGLSIAIFVAPIAASVFTAVLTAHLIARPHGTWWVVGWWVLVLGAPTIVLVPADRLARRALPLAVLLKMSMLFPDHAPKRLAVARRAGGTRDLARRLEEARTQGVEDEPVLAAEKILALAGALNAHDRLTRGHAERVRVLTDLIAGELALPTADRDRLRWSALLHDIGKLAVHPDILNKPERLDPDEWEVIRRHPLEGAGLTAPLAGWLGPWANTIAEHHEKYDGTGYPLGLAGTEISFGGRIVAVADCYDTMTTPRVYKKSISPAAARAELAACAGTHFDPAVVRAFLDVSISKMRVVAGPVAWIGSLPFVSSLPRVAQLGSTIGRVGAASATLAGAAAVGVLPSHAGGGVATQQAAVPSSAAPDPGGQGGNGTGDNGTSRGPAGASPRRPGQAGGSAGGNPSGSGAAASLINSPGSNGGGGAGSVPGSGGGSGGGGSGASGGSGSSPGSPASAPSAPTGVVATAGDGQTTVSWSAPADRGSPITSYTVTPYVGSSAQSPATFSSSATSQTVSGLANGTTYTFTVVATNAVGSSPASAPSPPVTPMAASLAIRDGGGQPGRAQLGDQIVVTFSTAPTPGAFCSGWSAGSFPDLVGPGVVVNTQHSSGSDKISSVTDSADCASGFHFGSIDMGQAGYFSGTGTTFGGTSANCSGSVVSGCTRIHWDGARTLTITLGKESNGQPTQSRPSVAVYTPDPALGVSGTISSPNQVQF